MIPLPMRRSAQAKAALFRNLANWVSARGQTVDLAPHLRAN
jgi:hypothetical protein